MTSNPNAIIWQNDVFVASNDLTSLGNLPFFQAGPVIPRKLQHTPGKHRPSTSCLWFGNPESYVYVGDIFQVCSKGLLEFSSTHGVEKKNIVFFYSAQISPDGRG